MFNKCGVSYCHASMVEFCFVFLIFFSSVKINSGPIGRGGTPHRIYFKRGCTMGFHRVKI
jgi:hypothetical protein